MQDTCTATGQLASGDYRDFRPCTRSVQRLQTGDPFTFRHIEMNSITLDIVRNGEDITVEVDPLDGVECGFVRMGPRRLNEVLTEPERLEAIQLLAKANRDDGDHHDTRGTMTARQQDYEASAYFSR